ncbi:hypothetical protein AFIC_001267 [[Pseudomonas] carboxydohydrogena]|uniref:Formylmethanofuran dehydrogenase subunit E domain-containing protein n=1 Tax=Afipia carboxydohydrogena TaxID=290 RepID=A0ABY8BV83_AFICR|nr:hypothetical protein [[Pseudomonas] carboxydohydrogena]WEF52769.1 hypothetical protein AFIC_001267 [[Pseudomonas] carboxydohydrogena]
MGFPSFFADVPAIMLRDPLAVFLGASDDGVITYTYADAVKLAGHSCPTVAGAYLMIRAGLHALYGDEMPARGGIEVYLRDPRDEGTTGVIAAVATLLTGAAPETGFGGIGAKSRFARRNLQHFEAPIGGLMALRRTDNGRGVILDLNIGAVPAAPEMQTVFPRVVAEQASADEQARFAALWQDRVERMLIRHADDPALVQVDAWTAEAA